MKKITVSRLKEIAGSIRDSGGWRDNATPEEQRFLDKEWERMPGFYSKYDAVLLLIREGNKDLVHEARERLTREFIRSLNEGDGCPLEADAEVNEGCKSLVHAVQEVYGEAWLGQINLSGEDRGKPERALWKWDQSTLYVFGSEFVLPCFSARIRDMIMERDQSTWVSVKDDAPKVKVILKAIEDADGYNLFWT